jgi:hypothetical protein
LKTEKELVKHQGIIEVENKMSTAERKALNVLLANVQYNYENPLEIKEFQIKIRDLMDLVNKGDSNNIDYMKKCLENLQAIRMAWNILSDDGEEEAWGIFSPIPDISYRKTKDGITCYYQLSDRIKQHAIFPEYYGKINLRIQREIDCKYELVMYELATKTLKNSDHASTLFIEKEKFEKLFGISDGSYKRFCDLKRRVIDDPSKKLKELTNIHTTAEFKRLKKSVTHIKLNFIRTSVLPVLPTESENLKILSGKEKHSLGYKPTFKIINDELRGFCQKFNITEKFLVKQKDKVLEKLGVMVDDDEKYNNYLLYIMNYTNEPKSKPVENKGKYFTGALQGNWVAEAYLNHFTEVKQNESKQISYGKALFKKELEACARNLMLKEQKEYTKSFLADHPEIISLVKEKEKSLVALTPKGEDFAEKFLYILASHEIVINSKYYDFPAYEEWFNDPVNKLKLEDKTFELMEKHGLLK